MGKRGRAKPVRVWALVGSDDGYIYYGATASCREHLAAELCATAFPCRIARVEIREVAPRKRAKAKGGKRG